MFPVILVELLISKALLRPLLLHSYDLHLCMNL